jgi:hypothetical protein
MVFGTLPAERSVRVTLKACDPREPLSSKGCQLALSKNPGPVEDVSLVVGTRYCLPMEISTGPARELELRAGQVGVLASYQRMISQGTALLWIELARLHEELTEPGYRRFVADEVACLLQISPRSACRLLDNALLSASFPEVLARLASGEWTPAHAQAVVGELHGSGLERPDQQQVLELVLARAGSRTPWQLAALVRASCLLVDLDAAERRREKATRNRQVTSAPMADGQAGLWAVGPAPEVRAIMCALDAGLGPREPGDERTLAERRFDLLRDLVCGDAQPGQPMHAGCPPARGCGGWWSMTRARCWPSTTGCTARTCPCRCRVAA